jgi:MFS family permease
MSFKKKSVFQFAEFSDFIIGRFLFVIGLRMLSTMIGWWLYEITGSVLYIGFIGLAEVLPSIGLSIHAGYTIDKSEKRGLLLKCVFLFAICVVSLLLLSILLVQKPHYKNLVISLIYVTVFCIGCTRAFLAPNFNAIMPSLISKEYVPSATTWSSTTWLFGSILGHAVGGFSIAYLGLSTSFFVIISLIFGSFSVLYLLLPKPSTIQKTESKKVMFKEIKEGIQFVFKNKVMLGALSLDLFAVFFGGVVSIIPAVALDILKVGPIGFAWLNLASDLGSAIMLIFLLIVPIKHKQGQKLFITMAVFGCSIIAFAFSHYFILSFIALFISGLANSINSVIRGTILQIKTPNHIRGRVMGINSLFTNSSNELGRLESGVAAYFMGIMPSVVFGGAMTLIIVIISYIKTPSLRKFEY